MVGYIRLHGSNDAQVIGVFRHMREKFADRQTRLAIALEGKGGTKGGTGLPFSFETTLFRQKLSMPLIEFGLGIEGVHVGGSAIHEQVDDSFGFWCEVGAFGCHRIHPFALKQRGTEQRS